jgi:hypothetical protein
LEEERRKKEEGRGKKEEGGGKKEVNSRVRRAAHLRHDS